MTQKYPEYFGVKMAVQTFLGLENCNVLGMNGLKDCLVQTFCWKSPNILLVSDKNVVYNQRFLLKSAVYKQHFLQESVGCNQHFCIFAGQMKILPWKHYL